MTAQNEKEKELKKVNQNFEQLTIECEEMGEILNDLHEKKQSRSKKLNTLQEKQIETKKKYDQELEKADIYSKRVKEYLGLRVESTSRNSTLLVFNNIDKCDTDYKCLLEFTLQGPNATDYKGNEFNELQRACT